MKIELTGMTGEVLSHSIHVRNESEESVSLTVTVRDFELTDDQITFVDNRPEPLSLSDWAKIPNNNNIISANGSKSIPIDIAIPNDAEYGEHFAFISLQFRNTDQEEQVRVATELLPLLFVTVTDEYGNINTNRSWELVEFNADRFNGGDILFKVKNTGSVHLTSSGTIKMRNVFTGVEETIDIPTWYLLRDKELDIIVDWAPHELFGVYNTKIEFSMDGESYKTFDKLFFIIPWWLTLILVIALLAAITLVFPIIISAKKLKKLMQESIQD